MTLAVISLNLMLLRRWANQKPFGKCADFSLWKLREQWIWTPLFVGGIYLLTQTFLEWPSLSWLCLNLLLVVSVVYFFQGISIFFFYVKNRVSPTFRLMAMFLFFLFFQPVAMFLILVGLFDFWFDFRKLKKVQTVPKQ
jgi:uncharacterized protein YybS (DUF2232 family)